MTSNNRYYRQANSFSVPITLLQILSGPGGDQANRLFTLYIENTGGSAITVTIVDILGDTTSFIVPLAVNSPGITMDNLPWELVAGGVFVIASPNPSSILAGMWASDIKREAALSATIGQQETIPNSYTIVQAPKPLTIEEFTV